MNCETCENIILSLDGREHLPLEAALHIGRCPECAKTWVLMRNARIEAQDYVDSKEVDMTERVMAALPRDAAPAEVRGGVSLKVWIGAGLFIVAAMLFSTYAEPFTMARASLGELFLMPISLTFGIVLSVYIVIGIASNMTRKNAENRGSV